MAVPYTFGNATTSIPLSQLDTNFATAITIGNTAVYLGNTTTSFGNVTLTNATISSVSTPITVAQGGTGLSSTPTAGQIDIGNGTGFTRTTLTAGSNITITNGNGSITIASTGGGNVSSISNGTSNVSIASSNGNITAYSANTLAMTIDTNQNATFAGTAVMSSPYTMRNKIINGAMQFAQRGSGVAVTGTTSYYALDRFFAVVNGGTTGAGSKMYQSTTVPSNFQYSLKFGRESGGTSTNNPTIGQVIESVNCYDMQGQTVTFSFYAKAGANYSASGSAFTVNLVTGTGTDQGSANIFGSWTGQVNNINNFTLTTSWQRFSFTASIGSTVTEIGFIAYYTPVGTAGADDYFYITGVQLERGTVATPFEYRNYQQELAMCQRYYCKSYDVTTAPGTQVFAGEFLMQTFTNNNVYMPVRYPVVMRTDPTLTFYPGYGAGASPTAGNFWNYSTSANVASAVGRTGTTGYSIEKNTGSASATIGWQYTASAEL